MITCPLCGFTDDGYTHHAGCPMLDMSETEQTAVLADSLEYWYRSQGYVWTASDDFNGVWLTAELTPAETARTIKGVINHE
jgi:hypothetical protein